MQKKPATTPAKMQKYKPCKYARKNTEKTAKTQKKPVNTPAKMQNTPL